MSNIQPIHDRNNAIINKLLALWELSVLKTHTFLSKEDIENIKPDAKNGLMFVEQLYAYFDENNEPQGFIGVQNQKIEMLFVNANKIGQGIGKQLLTFAIDELNANSVDVNEQNPQATGFYLAMGFCQIGRSEYDEQGRNFPILHLTLK